MKQEENKDIANNDKDNKIENQPVAEEVKQEVSKDQAISEVPPAECSAPDAQHECPAEAKDAPAEEPKQAVVAEQDHGQPPSQSDEGSKPELKAESSRPVLKIARYIVEDDGLPHPEEGTQQLSFAESKDPVPDSQPEPKEEVKSSQEVEVDSKQACDQAVTEPNVQPSAELVNEVNADNNKKSEEVPESQEQSAASNEVPIAEPEAPVVDQEAPVGSAELPVASAEQPVASAEQPVAVQELVQASLEAKDNEPKQPEEKPEAKAEDKPADNVVENSEGVQAQAEDKSINKEEVPQNPNGEVKKEECKLLYQYLSKVDLAKSNKSESEYEDVEDQEYDVFNSDDSTERKRIVRVDYSWGGRGFVRKDCIKNKITLFVKTFYGKRSMQKVTVDINAKVSSLIGTSARNLQTNSRTRTRCCRSTSSSSCTQWEE